jgi:hypothetical protein
MRRGNAYGGPPLRWGHQIGGGTALPPREPDLWDISFEDACWQSGDLCAGTIDDFIGGGRIEPADISGDESGNAGTYENRWSQTWERDARPIYGPPLPKGWTPKGPDGRGGRRPGAGRPRLRSKYRPVDEAIIREDPEFAAAVTAWIAEDGGAYAALRRNIRRRTKCSAGELSEALVVEYRHRLGVEKLRWLVRRPPS